MRQRGIRNFRIYIEVYARDACFEEYTLLVEDLCDRLHAVLKSADALDVLGVLSIIEAIVLRPGSTDMHEQAHRKCFARFVSYLRSILETHSKFSVPQCVDRKPFLERDLWNFIIISRAATTLARVAREGMGLSTWQSWVAAQAVL